MQPTGGEGPRLVPPIPDVRVRGRDAYGEGHFGARRDGGRRRHLGVDLIAAPGALVTSPVDGHLAGTIEPYPNDPAKRGRLSGVRIRTDDGYQVRVLYVDASAMGPIAMGPIAMGPAGSAPIIAGETPIGRVQDLSSVYPPKGGGRMTNHIHVDVSKDGRFFDPTACLAPPGSGT